MDSSDSSDSGSSFDELSDDDGSIPAVVIPARVLPQMSKVRSLSSHGPVIRRREYKRSSNERQNCICI